MQNWLHVLVMLRYKLESIIYILVQIYFLKLSKDSRNLVLGNITHQSKIFFFRNSVSASD